MMLLECPKCNKKSLKFHVKQNYGIDFNLANANQTILCPNCKRKIYFSVVSLENDKKVSEEM